MESSRCLVLRECLTTDPARALDPVHEGHQHVHQHLISRQSRVISGNQHVHQQVHQHQGDVGRVGRRDQVERLDSVRRQQHLADAGGVQQLLISGNLG